MPDLTGYFCVAANNRAKNAADLSLCLFDRRPGDKAAPDVGRGTPGGVMAVDSARN